MTHTDLSNDPRTASRPPSAGRRLFVFGACLAVAVTAGGLGVAGIAARAAATPRPAPAALPSVATVTVDAPAPFSRRRVHAARVEAARSVDVSFDAGGRILEVTVDEGDRVRAGDALARLDVARLEAERARLTASRDALAADAELARLELARQESLRRRDFASAEELDAARLGTVRSDARLVEAEAGVALLDVELDEAVVRAPFDGVVAERLLDPGTTVAPGTPVLRLNEAGAPRLRVGLPEARAATLDPGRAYRFEAGDAIVEARLVARRADVDVATRTVAALFEPVGDAVDALPVGRLLELVLDEPVSGPAFEVPLTALAEAERGLWSVLALDGPGDGGGAEPGEGTAGEGVRLVRVGVEIRHVDGERAWVDGPLEPGARIVADGRHRVGPGMRVRAVPALAHHRGDAR